MYNLRALPNRALFFANPPMIKLAVKTVLIVSVGIVGLGCVQAIINCESAIQAANNYNRLN